jgi:hypothetical protein
MQIIYGSKNKNKSKEKHKIKKKNNILRKFAIFKVNFELFMN